MVAMADYITGSRMVTSLPDDTSIGLTVPLVKDHQAAMVCKKCNTSGD